MPPQVQLKFYHMLQRCTVLRIQFFIFFVSFWVALPGYGLEEKAKKLFLENKFQAVIDELSPRTDSLSADHLLLLGKAYSQIANPLGAIKIYTLALAKKEKNFEAKTLIGHEYLLLKKDREALRTLREALEYNSKYEPAYLELEQLYTKKNNKYELRTLYIDMIEHIGEKPQYYVRLCELSYSSGLFEAAVNHCRKGIVLDKNEAKNYVYLALTFKETGKIPEAVDLLKRAAENFPKSFDAQITYALLLEEQKNYSEAQKYFRRAHKINSSSLRALIGFASTSVELQKFQEGLDLFTKACLLNKSTSISLRQALTALRGFKATNYISRYEDLADSCGLSSPIQ